MYIYTAHSIEPKSVTNIIQSPASIILLSHKILFPLSINAKAISISRVFLSFGNENERIRFSFLESRSIVRAVVIAASLNSIPLGLVLLRFAQKFLHCNAKMMEGEQ